MIENQQIGWNGQKFHFKPLKPVGTSFSMFRIFSGRQFSLRNFPLQRPLIESLGNFRSFEPTGRKRKLASDSVGSGCRRRSVEPFRLVANPRCRRRRRRRGGRRRRRIGEGDDGRIGGGGRASGMSRRRGRRAAGAGGRGR